jgi:hypothetical protein
MSGYLVMNIILESNIFVSVTGLRGDDLRECTAASCRRVITTVQRFYVETLINLIVVKPEVFVNDADWLASNSRIPCMTRIRNTVIRSHINPVKGKHFIWGIT